MSSEYGNIYIPMYLSGDTCRTPMNFASLKRLKRISKCLKALGNSNSNKILPLLEYFQECSGYVSLFS